MILVPDRRKALLHQCEHLPVHDDVGVDDRFCRHPGDGRTPNVLNGMFLCIGTAFLSRCTRPHFSVMFSVPTGRDPLQAIECIIRNWLLSAGALCVPGELNGLSAVADGPGDILKDQRKIQRAIKLGENLLRFSKIILEKPK